MVLATANGVFYFSIAKLIYYISCESAATCDRQLHCK